jgi:glycosyltransferase involved in cell wall biosynthesis
MRVALNLEQLLYSPPGGIGRYAAELARRLPGPDPDDGERTEVVAFVARHRRTRVADALARFELDTIDPVSLWLPRPVLYDTWNLLGLPRLSLLHAELRGVDIVHAPSLAVPPRAGRAPLVVTAHDAAALLFPETYPWRGRWFHRRGLDAAARRAELVITPTRAAADELVRLTKIRAERIRVVPHGVNLAQPDPPAVDAARAALGLDGVPYVLWVGTIEPRKNLSVLLDAFSAVVQAGLPHRLVVVGPPGWRGGARVTADSTLGERLVAISRRVRGPRLAALYRGASLLAFPSLHEGFGLPLLEAMAQETAILCSDVPVMHEVAGDAAQFVPATDVGAWRDALVSLLDDDATRQALAAAGRRRAGGFTWDRCIDRTRAVYRELLGRPR